jgi:hypothetical protein
MSKTLFRLYSNDNSKHYTAVLCKDGKYLEVKNPDTNTKTVFDSLEAWCEARDKTMDDIKEEEYKKSQKPELPELKISDNFHFGKWLHNTINKFGKKLLKNPDVIKALNTFTDTYTKYHNKVYSSTYELRSIPEKYNPKYLTFRNTTKSWDGKEEEDLWGNLGWNYVMGDYYNKTEEQKKVEQELAKQIRQEFKVAFKTICELVSPTIVPKLEKEYKTRLLKREMATNKRYVERYSRYTRKLMYMIELNMRKIQRLEKDLSSYTENKTKCQKKVDEIQKQLAALKGKIEKKKDNE